MKNDTQKAVIYCRVSSKSQSRDGHGLDSQEYRCREWAANKGYTVVAVFTDDISGGGDFMKRPGMVKLLRYLDDHSQHKHVVIFDDLKRYARDTVFHLKLRSEMALRNAERQCLNFTFENTPEGEFVETVLAAQSQLERQQNSRQVVQKMRARMMKGYWIHRAPRGYKMAKVAGHGKLMVRDEPVASIVQTALEGFANARFGSMVEVQAFLQMQPDFPKDKKGQVHIQRVSDMLNQKLYAGYYEFPDWDIGLMKGQHEPLISFETYTKIQDNLHGRTKAPVRKDVNNDFALRGFVMCDCCGKPLRSCWSTGRHEKYPYYLCHTKGCSYYGKSIRRDKIEGEFEELLKSITPSQATIEMVHHLIDEVKERRLGNHQEMLDALTKEKQLVERKIESFLERVVTADSPILISTYERQIKQLEERRILTDEKIRNCGRPDGSMREINRTSLAFLGNPLEYWSSCDLSGKRLVLKATFARPLAYHKNEGYRTPDLSLPFSVLAGLSGKKEEMVEHSGITSNSIIQLVQAIDTLSNTFGSKQNLNSKTFEWKPLALVA